MITVSCQIQVNLENIPLLPDSDFKKLPIVGLSTSNLACVAGGF
jgi:hypothetical protein